MSNGLGTMHQLNFTRPELFYYLFLLIPAALLMIIHYKRRFPVISTFFSSGHGYPPPKYLNHPALNLRIRYLISSLSFLLFFAALVCALANPHMGRRLVREFRRGCDVALAIDISRSMTALDSAPLPGGKIDDLAASRLERAAWIAQSLVAASENPEIMTSLVTGGGMMYLRFAVVLGKGSGVLAVPLTADTEAVRGVLDALSADAMTSRGTNLEALIDTATEAFLENAPAGRHIILLSDGEALSGSLSHAVERARARDINIVAIGLGSTGGALVPGGTFMPDGRPEFVRSSLQAAALRNAVERCDGIYIDGNNSDVLKILAEKIFPLAGDSAWILREEAGSKWHLFIIAALFFLGISVIATLTPNSPDSRQQSDDP
ncbi:MAG: VWA domain-containing protein [Spirochaetaceae bacterium]|nr:VWA domain-containing protein [Spirochaetaceae bacterium]